MSECCRSGLITSWGSEKNYAKRSGVAKKYVRMVWDIIRTTGEYFILCSLSDAWVHGKSGGTAWINSEPTFLQRLWTG